MTDAERQQDVDYLNRMVEKGVIPEELRTKAWAVLDAMPVGLPAPAMSSVEAGVFGKTSEVNAFWGAGPFHLSAEIKPGEAVYWFWQNRDTGVYGGINAEAGEVPEAAREWAEGIAAHTPLPAVTLDARPAGRIPCAATREGCGGCRRGNVDPVAAGAKAPSSP